MLPMESVAYTAKAANPFGISTHRIWKTTNREPHNHIMSTFWYYHRVGAGCLFVTTRWGRCSSYRTRRRRRRRRRRSRRECICRNGNIQSKSDNTRTSCSSNYSETSNFTHVGLQWGFVVNNLDEEKRKFICQNSSIQSVSNTTHMFNGRLPEARQCTSNLSTHNALYVEEHTVM